MAYQIKYIEKSDVCPMCDIMQYYYSCEMLHVKFHPLPIINATSQQSHTIRRYDEHFSPTSSCSLVLSWTVDGLDSAFPCFDFISAQKYSIRPVLSCYSSYFCPRCFCFGCQATAPASSKVRAPRSLLSTRHQVHTIHMDMYPSAMGK